MEGKQNQKYSTTGKCYITNQNCRDFVAQHPLESNDTKGHVCLERF